MDVEREIWIYFRERFPTHAAFDAALAADPEIPLQWVAQLPAEKRDVAFAHIATTVLKSGPCSLVRMKPRKEVVTDIAEQLLICTPHALDDLRNNKWGMARVELEIIATFDGGGGVA
jgi:hypothetical protein